MVASWPTSSAESSVHPVLATAKTTQSTATSGFRGLGGVPVMRMGTIELQRRVRDWACLDRSRPRFLTVSTAANPIRPAGRGIVGVVERRAHGAQGQSSGWISGRIVRGLIATAADQGLGADDLLTRAGLGGSAQTLDEVVSIETHCEVWAYAMRTLNDPGLPARVAARRSTGDLQIRGFAAATSRTGWEACDRAARFAHLTTNTMTVSVTQPRAGVARVTLHRDGARSLGLRSSTECALLSWVTQIRGLLDASFVPTEVYVRHRLPDNLGAHRTHLGEGAALVGEASFDGIEFPDPVLDRTPASANPAMRAFFDAQAEAMLARIRPCRPAALRRLHEKILQALPSGTPKMAAIAETLGQSERGLRRTLEEHGKSYTETVATVRLQLAEQLLGEPELSLAEVAFALGYSEHSAFTRFFSAHAGKSPRAYRDALRSRAE